MQGPSRDAVCTQTNTTHTFRKAAKSRPLRMGRVSWIPKWLLRAAVKDYYPQLEMPPGIGIQVSGIRGTEEEGAQVATFPEMTRSWSFCLSLVWPPLCANNLPRTTNSRLQNQWVQVLAMLDVFHNRKSDQHGIGDLLPNFFSAFFFVLRDQITPR